MDPYSELIINAVETAKSAIVKIDVTKRKQNKKLPGSSGSGFFYSSDGYLFTNSHVIGGAEKLNITLHDGNQFEASLVGEDADTWITLHQFPSCCPG